MQALQKLTVFSAKHYNLHYINNIQGLNKATEKPNQSRDSSSRSQSGLEWVAERVHADGSRLLCGSVGGHFNGRLFSVPPTIQGSAGLVGIRHVGRVEKSSAILPRWSKVIHPNFSASVVRWLIFSS